MLLAALHAPSRHRPDPVFDLVWQRSNHFASARCGQDQELESPCGYSLLGAECSHKPGQLVVRQSGMMFNLAYLGACRQELIEMTAPARWIVALAITRTVAQSSTASIRPRSRD